MTNLVVLLWMIGDRDVVDKWVVVGGNGDRSVLRLWWMYKLWSMVVSYYCCGSLAESIALANRA